MATKRETETGEVEQEYTVAEFAAVAKTVFNATPDIVTAALRVAGVTRCTKSTAVEIVENFRRQEV